MKKRIFTLILILLLLPLIGASCINIRTKGGTDGGVFKSTDGGGVWQQQVFVRQIKKNKFETIDHVNILKMNFYPKESKTIYIATREDGMYVTYNAGERWSSIFTDKGQINDIAIDPNSRNIVYVATGNQIFKSTDGGENWAQAYLESLPDRAISCLVVDSYDTNKVYAGISDGRLIRSLDGGFSWKLVNKFKENITQILINKNNTRIIYVTTSHSGIFRTTNFGESWTNITVNDKRTDLKELEGINEFKFAVFDQTKSDSLLIATRYGLLKTDNGGDSWQVIKLVSVPKTTEILSIAINPKDNQEIYYGIANALYKTRDGGRNWETKSLLTARAAQYLLIDPQTPEIVYLGVMKIAK